MTNKEHRTGLMEMTAAMVISGTLGWFVAMARLDPQTVVFYRCLFGAMALGVICWRMGFFAHRLSLRQWLLAVAGGVAIVGNWVMIFAAFDRASISVATIIYQVQPFMLLILGALFLGEAIRSWQVGWLLVAFGGFVLISLQKPGFIAQEGHYMLGIAFSLGAAMLYAAASLITKRLKGIAPHYIAFIQVVVGSVLLLPLASSVPPVSATATWVALITLGLVHTALMYILLYGAIQKLPLASTASLTFIYPLVATVVDVAGFGQSFTLLQIAGMMLVLLAAAGVNLGWRLPHKASEAASEGQSP